MEPRILTSPRGTQLHTLGWPQEAAYRMLHNNLDPAVAEHPEKLVFCDLHLDLLCVRLVAAAAWKQHRAPTGAAVSAI